MEVEFLFATEIFLPGGTHGTCIVVFLFAREPVKLSYIGISN